MSLKNSIRVIWDVHWKIESYAKLIKNASSSIQVWDFWFRREHQLFIKKFDSDKHKIVFWNHDDMRYVDYDHSLWHFWVYESKWVKVFAIRWWKTIDAWHRMEWVSIRANEEELNTKQQNECYDEYLRVKPDVVISHDCPSAMYPYYWIWPEKLEWSTPHLLQKCFEEHQPKVRVHWHHHRDSISELWWTIFVCLNELSYLDLKKDSFKFNWEKYDY